MGCMLHPGRVPSGRACWVIFNLYEMHVHEVYWSSTLLNKVHKSQDTGLTFGWTSAEISAGKFPAFHG